MTFKCLHRTIVFPLLAVTLLSAFDARHARAEEEPATELGAATPRECTGRFVAGPAVGIPLGAGTATLGGVFIAAGQGLFGDPVDNSPGAFAAGSILLAAGLTAAIYSSVKLAKNMKVRRRMCGERSYQPLASAFDTHRRKVHFEGTGFRF